MGPNIKTYKNLYQQIYTFANLYQAYCAARKGMVCPKYVPVTMLVQPGEFGKVDPQ